jgi:hypothetical protein
MSTWLGRNVYTKNLETFPTFNGTKGNFDQPGLKEMTLKAVGILHARAQNAGTGFMLMSEAASIDKVCLTPCPLFPRFLTLIVSSSFPPDDARQRL